MKAVQNAWVLRRCGPGVMSGCESTAAPPRAGEVAAGMAKPTTIPPPSPASPGSAAGRPDAEALRNGGPALSAFLSGVFLPVLLAGQREVPDGEQAPTTAGLVTLACQLAAQEFEAGCRATPLWVPPDSLRDDILALECVADAWIDTLDSLVLHRYQPGARVVGGMRGPEGRVSRLDTALRADATLCRALERLGRALELRPPLRPGLNPTLP